MPSDKSSSYNYSKFIDNEKTPFRNCRFLLKSTSDHCKYPGYEIVIMTIKYQHFDNKTESFIYSKSYTFKPNSLITEMKVSCGECKEMCYILRTIYFVLYTSYYILRAIYFVLYTIYFVQTKVVIALTTFVCTK